MITIKNRWILINFLSYKEDYLQYLFNKIDIRCKCIYFFTRAHVRVVLAIKKLYLFQYIYTQCIKYVN